MRWGLQVLPDALLVCLYGALDQSLGDMWEKAANRSVVLGKKKIIIDFSGVESVDPLGVVLVGYGLHHFQELGMPIALIRPPAGLLPVLQNYGLNGIPSVFMPEQDERLMN